MSEKKDLCSYDPSTKFLKIRIGGYLYYNLVVHENDVLTKLPEDTQLRDEDDDMVEPLCAKNLQNGQQLAWSSGKVEVRVKKSADTAPAPVGVERYKSFFDNLPLFLDTAKAEGCLPTDPLYHQRTVTLTKLRRCLDSGTNALIHAPPASGTSLLQAFVRGLLDESPRRFYPVILQARGRAFQSNEGMLLLEVKKAIFAAKSTYVDLKIVLIVDEGQRVDPILGTLAKEGKVPVIAASSYYSDADDADSPTMFDVFAFGTLPSETLR